MISNLCLLFLAIAKTALLCGIGPGIAFAIFCEQVSGRAVSHSTSVALSDGNKLARNVLEAA